MVTELLRAPDDRSEAVESVLATLPCSVTLPAGAGKTELIAAVVSAVARRGGTSLVLTHTHAGVDALRRRMARFGVGREHVAVRTIDAWSFDLIRHYPLLAGVQVPEVPDWTQSRVYHQSAVHAVASTAVRRMLKVSYQLVLVDEYQDCLADQHRLVLAICNAVPAAVFGDPLQGLFDFGGNQPVAWADDVLPAFPQVDVASYPWRWETDNPTLGAWLVSIRSQLLRGEPIDLRDSPAAWVQSNGFSAQNSACYAAPGNDGSVVALGRFRPDCVAVASRMSGTYSVMEALDEKMTRNFCKRFASDSAPDVTSALVQFAVDCATGVAAYFPAASRARLRDGKVIGTNKPELVGAVALLNGLLTSVDLHRCRQALIAISRLPGVRIYCREAWREVLDALRHAALDSDLSVAAALDKARSQTRRTGRRAESRVISRPLLVKGLEYRHAVVLDADQYKAAELYVALTRASKSLTVLSRSPIITPRSA